MPRDESHILNEALVLRAQARDEEALTLLVRRWSPPLLRHAARLTDDTHTAHDVLQDAWVTIVRNLRALDDPACFPAFALRIVTRRAADHTRRRQRARRHTKAAATAAPKHRPPSPDAPAEEADESRALRDAIAALPKPDQIILALRYHEDLSIAAIAHVLSIPRGTVKSRLHAARAQLRRKLERSTP